jgi:glycosyltransferase involved in cell wall biosynthesis
MKTLLQDEELCIKLGLEAERLIHERFTWEASAEGLIKIYQDLLESKSENHSRG